MRVALLLIAFCLAAAHPAIGAQPSILARIPNGGNVQSLFEGADGNLYGSLWRNEGTSAASRLTLFRVNATTGQFSNLITLNNSNAQYHGAGTPLFPGAGGAMYGSFAEQTTKSETNSNGSGGFWTNTWTTYVSKIFRLDVSGAFTVLASLTDGQQWSYNPPLVSRLLQGTDGNIYGVFRTNVTFTNPPGIGFPTTTSMLAVFRLTTNGEFSTLAVLTNATNYYHYYPPHGLYSLQAADGAFYATAPRYDEQSLAVYRIGTNGQWTTLGALPISYQSARFVRGTDGTVYLHQAYKGAAEPPSLVRVGPSGLSTVLATPKLSDVRRNLFQGADGNFYGYVDEGLPENFGSVSRLGLDGEAARLAAFKGPNGAFPQHLFEGSDGSLFGTTRRGGDGYFGTIFRVSKDGELRTLGSFNGTNGAEPGLLFQSKDGTLYGLAERSAPDNEPVIFKLRPDYNAAPPAPTPRPPLPGQVTTLLKFTNGYPAFVHEGADGHLYGVKSEWSAQGSARSIFRLKTDGEYTPLAALPQNAEVRSFFRGTDGNAYGTFLDTNTATVSGTVSGTIQRVFRLDAKGALSILGSVNLQAYENHYGFGLFQASDRNLYGIFRTNVTNPPDPAGVTPAVFRMKTNGEFSTLAVLPSAIGGFQLSYPQLLEGVDGTFYATTSYRSGDTNLLSVFSIRTNAQVTTLATLAETNGFHGQLLRGSDGYVYLHNRFHAQGNAQPPSGSLLRLGPGGAVTVMSSSALNGFSSPIQGADGNFYGLGAGEGFNASGSVTRLLPNGEESTLETFRGPNGEYPDSLFQGIDGALYGFTYEGGDNFSGTVFRVTSEGQSATLAAFGTGHSPETLFQAKDGSLYGTGLDWNGDWSSIFKVEISANAPARPVEVLPPTPEGITSIAIIPQSRAVKAGKKSRSVKLMVMVANNSMKDMSVPVALSAEPAGVVTLPQSSMEMTVPGKKNAKQKAKTKRQSFTVLVPPTASGDVTIKASVGALSASSTLRVQAAKK